MSKSTKEYLKDYEDYLRIHNFSRSTVQAYKLGLRERLEFRQAHNLSERINQEQARAFFLFKYDTRAIGKRSIMYSALRKYFREVLQAECTSKKIRQSRGERTLPISIDKEEVKRK